MKSKDKMLITSNHTIDKFLVPKSSSNVPFRKAQTKFKVPHSSGLLPSTPPTGNIIRYPKNPEVRDYQQQIVLSCVCMNTLVCLPTGLGKTHIAAVLIANFVNWFPDKKVIFLAPTRPLVRQQVSALNHMRDMVPKNLVLQVNGQLAAKKRMQLYDSFRVIFGTPQTIENDLRGGKLDKNKIILLIFDQCHRSVGDASYAKIIRLLSDVQAGFRIVGLSATPGHEPQRVQAVINNLNLSKIIYKDEKDPEVKRYLNEKTILEVEIRSSDVINEVTEILNEFAKPSISLLIKLNLVSPWLVKNGIKSTSFFLIREDFSQKINLVNKKEKNIAYAALRIISFLIESKKSLSERGFETFRRSFFGSLTSSVRKSMNREERVHSQEELMDNSISVSEVLEIMCKPSSVQSKGQIEFEDELSSNTFNHNQESSLTLLQSNKSSKLPPKFQEKIIESSRYKRLYQIFQGRKSNKGIHPKLQKLIEILKNFFANNEGRAIIFTNFRVTAKEIQQYLKPVTEIKSELFFGQSKTVFQDTENSTSIIYLKQSEQLKIIQRFKKGEINTLISTSIGEEGLDIGEVDCIICYDGGHSPIRSIQRRGRTGRKRAGVVYFLLMEGKEWDDYKNGMKKEVKMKSMLTKDLHKFKYYSFNSTLFEEKTEIVIEHYDNQLTVQEEQQKKEVEQKQTKKRFKKEQTKDSQDGVVTKKRKNKKKSLQADDDNNIQINPTTISDLLKRYAQNEQLEIGCKIQEKQQNEESLEEVQSECIGESHYQQDIYNETILQQVSQQQINKQQIGAIDDTSHFYVQNAIIQKQSNAQEILSDQKQWESFNLGEICKNQEISQNDNSDIPIIQNCKQINETNIDISESADQKIERIVVKEQRQFEPEKEENEDDLFEQFYKYRASKKENVLPEDLICQNDRKEQADSINQPQEQTDSMSQNQFLDLMEKIRYKRRIQKLIQQQGQDI